MDLSPPSFRPLAWSLLPADWQTIVAELGLPAYRGRQLWEWLYKRGAASWDAMTNLPAAVRNGLAARFDLEALQVGEVLTAADGVRKLLLVCRDGEKIETVLIPTEDRRTVCVSTQVGCAFGCAFCASGAGGFVRDLESGEIVGQIMMASRAAAAIGRITHIVFMGMGEPLANYDHVLKTVRILNDYDGLAIGARRMTLSTNGIVPGIRRLAGEGLQVELSVSLHAPNDDLRSRLMPVNRRWPIEELLTACHDYTETTGRIITFEYTLIRDLNDRPEHAEELVRRLRGLKCRVNLIPLSPVREFEGAAPEPRVCEAFAAYLVRNRVNTTLRRSRGGAVQAACGQLRRNRASANGAAAVR